VLIMMRLLPVLLLIANAAAAEPTAVDPDIARLQAAEAAVRAGRNTHPAIVVNRPAAQAAEKHALAMPLQGAPREFPVPARTEQQPSSGGMQALIADSMSRQASAPKPANGDAQATAAGLDALATFRHDHGVAP
jgi:hypothetical protein